MPLMPFHLPKVWLQGLVSVGPVAAGMYFLLKAIDRGATAAPEAAKRSRDRGGAPVAEPWDAPTGVRRPRAVQAPARPDYPLLLKKGGYLLLGLALLDWSLGTGRAWALRRRRASGVKPRDGEDQEVRRPDGTVLHVETYGHEDGTPIVFIHGLGSDCDEWFEIRRLLDGRHRLIDWDLPGLGESTPPGDGDWSIERMARDLEAVLAATCDRPAILVGHSLGAMILLTFCRLFPEALGTRVAGLVLAHVTYTNPLHTTEFAGLATALQWPVVEPLFRLTIPLSPLLRPLCTLAYLNGMAHRTLDQSLFTGRESREVLDFLAGYFLDDAPSAVARLSLAMLRYDETATLPTITVPTLIVVGDRDDSCLPEAHAFMAERIPGARLYTLSPAKHGGLLEHPREFTEVLEGFVASCTHEGAARSEA